MLANRVEPVQFDVVDEIVAANPLLCGVVEKAGGRRTADENRRSEARNPIQAAACRGGRAELC